MFDFLNDEKKIEDKEYYGIKEFSKLTGVTAQTLYNWERKGLLICHHRSAGGHRVYSKEQLSEYLSRGKRTVNLIYIRRDKMTDCTKDDKYIRAFIKKTSKIKDTPISFLDKVSKINITASKVFQNCLDFLNKETIEGFYIFNKDLISDEVKIIFESIARMKKFKIIYVDEAIKDAIMKEMD